MASRIVRYMFEFQVEVDDDYVGDNLWNDAPDRDDLEDQIMKMIEDTPNKPSTYRFVWNTVAQTEKARDMGFGRCVECSRSVARHHENGKARLHKREILTGQGVATGVLEWCPGSWLAVVEPTLRERCAAGGHRQAKTRDSGQGWCSCESVEFFFGNVVLDQ